MTVRKIRLVKAAVPLGMKAEHLMAWLRSVTREKDPDTETSDKVIIVVQISFQEGYIPESLMWTIMVLVYKGSRDYIVIRFVETIWNVFTSIINIRL